MSKRARLLSGKVKKVSGAELDPSRSDFLDLSNAEPDLDLPSLSGSLLVSTNTGERSWTDKLLVTNDDVNIRGTLVAPNAELNQIMAADSSTISVEADLVVQGNFTVQGTTTTIESTTLAIDDKNIELAKNATTALEADGAGITITGPTTPATILYDSNVDRLVINKVINATVTDITVDVITSQNLLAEADITGSDLVLVYDDSAGSYKKASIDSITNQGSDGVDGAPGFTGSIGFTGSKGDQGAIGFTGSQGPPGTGGADGVGGFTGSQGNTGFVGSQGFTGSQGDLGYTGSQGDIGFTGSQGETGFVGSVGYTGSQGDIGYTGSQGIQGILGYTGSQGPPGPGGVDGSGGFTGSQGNTGYTGSIGFTGSAGAGFTGSAGTDGTVGFTGSQGEIGFTGSSGVGVTTLDELSDVTITTPSSGQILKYDGTGWINDTVAGSGGGTSRNYFVKTYNYQGILRTNTSTEKLIIHDTATLETIKMALGTVGNVDTELRINKNGTSFLTTTIGAGVQYKVESNVNESLSANDLITVDILANSSARDLFVTFVYYTE